MKKRIEWVDVYKGILIFLVVFGHGLDGIVNDVSMKSNYMYDSLYYVRKVIYSFHMPAFFLAAGFFANALFKKINTKYFLHRFKRLAWPYFLWGFITAVFMQMASSQTNHGQGLIDWLKSPVVPFGEFWFLYVYFLIFLVHFVLSALLKRRANIVLFILSVILFIVEPFLPNVWVVHELCTDFIYYAIGLYTLNLLSNIKNIFSLKSSIITVVLYIFSLVVFLNTTDSSFINHYVNFLTAIFGSLIFIQIAKFISNSGNYFNKINDFFGKNSMSIYVMHVIPLAATRIILLHYVGVTNLWLVAIISTLVSLIGCSLVILFCRKFKLLNIVF